MRTATVTLCVAVLVTTIASGQTVTPQAASNGRVKIWTGASLVVAGLAVLPDSRARRGYDPSTMSVGLVAAGGALIGWGMSDRRKARQPNTTFGITFGRTRALQVRRSW
jgi:hypothetical protein